MDLNGSVSFFNDMQDDVKMICSAKLCSFVHVIFAKTMFCASGRAAKRLLHFYCKLCI